MEEIEVMSSTYQEEAIAAADALRRGLVILYPTDTVWGIGCDIENVSAVERVYEIKKVSRDAPLVILVSDVDMLKEVVGYIHPRVETLLSHHVQPLTLIYNEIDGLPEHVISKQGTAAIRITLDPFCQTIIQRLGRPIISTSANIKGEKPPLNYHQINSEIKSGSDYIVGIRQDDMEERQPSIIARFNAKGELEFLRK